MAITDLRIVSGDGTGTGTGAAVTWPTSGNPSLAVTGLFYTNAEGTGFTTLTTPSDRGIHYAWNAQGDGDDQPSWATGPGYVEVPVARTGEFVEFLTQTVIGTLTAGQMQDGIDITVGIQFAVSGTFVAGTTPQNNNTAISFMEGDATAQSFQMRAQSRNVGGFAPGIALSWGDYTGTETVGFSVGGSSSSEPMVMLGYNKWYQLRVRWKRSTGAAADDGATQVWINGQQVYRATGCDNFYGAVGNLARLLGLGSSYSTAITGCKIRYCPPVKVRSVPDADLAPDWYWQDNTADDRDLRRWYPCLYSGAGSPWTFSGTATLPALGTVYTSSGNNPGRTRFVIAGTAAQTFTLTSPTLWSGTVGDSPLGSDGWVWLRFSDLYHVNACDFTVTINGPSAAIHTIDLKASDNKLYIDGVEKQASVATSTRYEILVGLKAGQTVVLLHDLTTTSKSSSMIRKYAVTNSWTANGLGTVTIAGTFSGSVSAEVGPIGAYARLRVVECDSYISAAAATVSPTFATASQRIGQYWNQGCDTTVPNGWDPCPTTGGLAGIDIALCLARSGGKLSESEANFWPNLTGFPVHGLLIGGVVNDITAANDTSSEAWTEANTLADRIVAFATWCVNSGGTCVIGDTLNLASGSGTGSYTTFSLSEPNMVAKVLPQKLSDAAVLDGRVTHANSAAMLEQNTDYQSSDGVHPSANGARAIAVNTHHAAKAAQSFTGYNTNGTVSNRVRPTGRGFVFVKTNRIRR